MDLFTKNRVIIITAIVIIRLTGKNNLNLIGINNLLTKDIIFKTKIGFFLETCNDFCFGYQVNFSNPILYVLFWIIFHFYIFYFGLCHSYTNS